jgi:hypothetical protein
VADQDEAPNCHASDGKDIANPLVCGLIGSMRAANCGEKDIKQLTYEKTEAYLFLKLDGSTERQNRRQLHAV